MVVVVSCGVHFCHRCNFILTTSPRKYAWIDESGSLRKHPRWYFVFVYLIYFLLRRLLLSIGYSANLSDPQAVLETIMRKDQEIKELRDEVTRLTAEVRTWFDIY